MLVAVLLVGLVGRRRVGAVGADVAVGVVPPLDAELLGGGRHHVAVLVALERGVRGRRLARGEDDGEALSGELLRGAQLVEVRVAALHMVPHPRLPLVRREVPVLGARR